MAMRAKVTEIGGEAPTNGGKSAIESGVPYTATIEIKGTAELLFHRWNVEAVQSKADAAKGSKAKKSDNIESYVYRNDDGFICLPGEYLRGSIVGAAKFRQDPRSPRKSAQDLFKAAIVSLTPLAPVLVNGKRVTDWEFEDRRRVSVQRAGITRSRPAFRTGWQAEVKFLVNLPQYVPEAVLHEVVTQAGMLIGVADFRPSYGRFLVAKFSTGLT